MNADNPKHLDMKKYDTNAPNEPQLFLNSLFLFKISCELWSKIKLWSYCPVAKYEMNAIIVYMDKMSRIIPKIKFKMSFCRMPFSPIASLKDLS